MRKQYELFYFIVGKKKKIEAMTSSSLKQGTDGKNIKVYVRVRPFNSKQVDTGACIDSITSKSISIREKQSRESHDFTFDGVFGEVTTQNEIYKCIGQDVVGRGFEGINGTIFCYGQTSSGKTHTCVGTDFYDEDNCGILPRLIKETLTKIREMPDNIEAKMKISMVEIYNEKIKDLLDSSKSDLKIRSNKTNGIFIDGVTQKYILSQEEAFNYLKHGIEHRSVACTNMNSQSSRSHMLFIITISTHDVYTGEAHTAKLTLVDLAGSEKISKTGAEGKVLEEAKKINTSLTALGKVINSLSQNKNVHIPYRDSKLTRLLQQSLGGNSQTNLIINVSPSLRNDSETLTSVRFGWRAKAIKNEPKVNKSYTISELLALLEKAQKKIKDQQKIIKQLSQKKRAGGYGSLKLPKMITLHMINIDDDETETMSQFDAPSQMLDELSQRELSSLTCIPEEEKQKTKLTQSADNWQQKEKKIGCSMMKSPLSSFRENQSKKYVSFKQKQEMSFPQTIEPLTHREKMQQTKENLQYPIHQKSSLTDFISQKKEISRDTSGIKKLSNQKPIHDIYAIRENIFKLKLQYLKEKKQNRIKQIIIERKNRLLQRCLVVN